MMWYACDGHIQFVQFCNTKCMYYLMLYHMLNITCLIFYALQYVAKYHFIDIICKIVN